jgi:Skp family chaperone for outer membrane proteins
VNRVDAIAAKRVDCLNSRTHGLQDALEVSFHGGKSMRALLWTSGLIVALATFLAVGRLSADGDENKNEEPQTRIGLVNLTYVIKNYSKYKDFQEEIRDIIGPFQQKDGQLREKLEQLRLEGQQLSEQASRGGKQGEAAVKKLKSVEKKGKQLVREMEDNQAEAKLKLGKRSDDEMKILFIDVLEAVKRYSADHDLDAVLHYNDALTRVDFLSAQNIARKLNTGALMPLTSAPGIDISKDISDLLNFGERNKG